MGTGQNVKITSFFFTLSRFVTEQKYGGREKKIRGSISILVSTSFKIESTSSA